MDYLSLDPTDSTHSYIRNQIKIWNKIFSNEEHMSKIQIFLSQHCHPFLLEHNQFFGILLSCYKERGILLRYLRYNIYKNNI